MADIIKKFEDAAKADPDKFVKVTADAPLTSEQLMKMLVASQNAAAEANAKLAEALLESRKPYIDPKVLQAREQANKDRQEQIEAEMRRRAFNKKHCTHRRESNNSLNIKWMEHSGGIVLGVCGRCFSQFDARVPEDGKFLWEDLKAQANMGRAGQHARRGGAY